MINHFMNLYQLMANSDLEHIPCVEYYSKHFSTNLIELNDFLNEFRLSSSNTTLFHRSEEWQTVSDDVKESVNIQFDHDGEFWSV